MIQSAYLNNLETYLTYPEKYQKDIKQLVDKVDDQFFVFLFSLII